MLCTAIGKGTVVDVSAFANRLSKNMMHYGRWARRQGLDAWRAYDKDVPQYPLALDIYGKYCHLQEYDTGWSMSDEEHAVWLADITTCIAKVSNINPAHIIFKTRRRQRGTNQYQKLDDRGSEVIVQEFGQKFIINLHAYLDTGLFLDHRNARYWIREQAAGCRFLNLFAYTGSFTVYAACGGATSSETVDLSNRYQQWSQRNFILNGLDLARHSLVRADVIQYLSEARMDKKQFDLIVMDPPTFSNSKKMRVALDIQRDHVWLIKQAMQLLSESGTLYFSTNCQQFVLNSILSALYQVRDLSKQSIPEDFRNKKIHRCFRINRRAAEQGRSQR